MDRYPSDQALHDGDHCEIERSPPPGGFVWSDEDIEPQRMETSPPSAAAVTSPVVVANGANGDTNDESGRNSKRMRDASPQVSHEQRASGIRTSKRNIEIDSSSEIPALSPGLNPRNYATSSSKVYDLRSRKRRRYEAAPDDTVPVMTRGTSAVRKIRTFGRASNKSSKRRMESLKLRHEFDKSDTLYAEIEEEADKLLRSCVLMLRDSSASLGLPVDLCYEGADEGPREGSTLENPSGGQTLRRHSECPEWLLDASCVQRPYSVVQLVVGKVFNTKSTIVHAYITENSNVRIVGRRIYALLKISLKDFDEAHWKMGVYPEARWRVRLGESGQLARLRIDKARTIYTAQKGDGYHLPEGSGRLDAVRDIGEPDEKVPEELQEPRYESTYMTAVSLPDIHPRPERKTAEEVEQSPGPSQVNPEHSVGSQVKPVVQRHSVLSLKTRACRSSSLKPKKPSVSIPPNGINRRSRSIRFSSDTLTDDTNISDSRFTRSRNRRNPLQELLRETVSKTPLRSLSNYLRKHNIEIGHLAGVGGFGFVVVIRRVRHLLGHQTSVMRVLKFVPIENLDRDAANLLREVRVGRQLSGLRKHAVFGYPEYFGCEYLQGRLPHELKVLLEKVPDTMFLTKANLTKWLFIEMAYAGVSLDCYRLSPQEEWSLNDYRDALSIAGQLLVSLAEAEKMLKFEHRDCHWGNILLDRAGSEDEKIAINFGQDTRMLPTRGIRLAIIDFSLVRCTLPDGNNNRRTVHYVNVNESFPEIFQQSGSLQFNVYRQMANVIGDNWAGFHPRTNVLWIEYLLEKLLTDISYKARNKKETCERASLRRYLENLQAQPAVSATECLQRFLKIL